jgi:hypothetical protein
VTSGRPVGQALPSEAVIVYQEGKCMSLHDRIVALREKHAALERAIDEENSRPHPDDDAISDLKRQKLRIKDEIFQLESH